MKMLLMTGLLFALFSVSAMANVGGIGYITEKDAFSYQASLFGYSEIKSDTTSAKIKTMSTSHGLYYGIMQDMDVGLVLAYHSSKNNYNDEKVKGLEDIKIVSNMLINMLKLNAVIGLSGKSKKDNVFTGQNSIALNPSIILKGNNMLGEIGLNLAYSLKGDFDEVEYEAAFDYGVFMKGQYAFNSSVGAALQVAYKINTGRENSATGIKDDDQKDLTFGASGIYHFNSSMMTALNLDYTQRKDDGTKPKIYKGALNFIVQF